LACSGSPSKKKKKELGIRSIVFDFCDAIPLNEHELELACVPDEALDVIGSTDNDATAALDDIRKRALQEVFEDTDPLLFLVQNWEGGGGGGG
jgi:hypothetical protein